MEQFSHEITFLKSLQAYYNSKNSYYEKIIFVDSSCYIFV